MRDDDPHKLVSIHEMFERIVNTLLAIELVLREQAPGEPSSDMQDVMDQIGELRDILDKADD
jgi:hypothetical protein